jgi:pullulanase/glycogen debranching enzyme
MTTKKDPFDWDTKTLEEREAEVLTWRRLMDMRRKTSALDADYWWKVGTSALGLFMIFFITVLYIALEYATR